MIQIPQMLRQIPIAVNNRASLHCRHFISLVNVKQNQTTGISLSDNRVSNFADTGIFCVSGKSTLTRGISQGIFLQKPLAAQYSTVSSYLFFLFFLRISIIFNL